MGGSGRWLWELYRRLPAGAIHVAAGDAPGADVFDGTHQLPVTRVPLGFSSWGLLHVTSSLEYRRAVRRLGEITADVTPEVIHCAKAVPEGVLGWWLAKRRGVPFWCYVHGEELSLAHTSRELRWMTARVLARAERVVANSRHTQRLLVEGWAVPPSRITVLHPGVDTTRFVPAPKDERARARLDWSGRQVVLTVGALQKRKGQDMLIRALPGLRDGFPRCSTASPARAGSATICEGLARSLGVRGRRPVSRRDCRRGSCRVLSAVRRVRAAQSASWLGFRRFWHRAVEAQACGRPVVTGLSGGTVEAMDPGRSGHAVDCSSPEPLLEAVADLLADASAADSLGAHGRAWVCERFDWAVAARAAEAAFAGALHRDAPARRA